MVQSGSGEVGAAKLTGEVLDIVAKVPEMVKNMTGVNIMKVIYYFNYLLIFVLLFILFYLFIFIFV